MIIVNKVSKFITVWTISKNYKYLGNDLQSFIMSIFIKFFSFLFFDMSMKECLLLFKIYGLGNFACTLWYIANVSCQ